MLFEKNSSVFPWVSEQQKPASYAEGVMVGGLGAKLSCDRASSPKIWHLRHAIRNSVYTRLPFPRCLSCHEISSEGRFLASLFRSAAFPNLPLVSREWRNGVQL